MVAEAAAWEAAQAVARRDASIAASVLEEIAAWEAANHGGRTALTSILDSSEDNCCRMQVDGE